MVNEKTGAKHSIHQHRKLAAIMFTDLAGYTALGQRNESLSLALVMEQRKLLRPIIIRHGGKEIKTMGDATLIKFSNALDGVRCAYDIQRAMREFNVSMPEDKRLHLRVGLHLGDVVEYGGDISGDAVNIASRVEHFADEGGVCFTRQVFDQVYNKFELSIRSIGSKTLKNVNLPVELYKLVMPWEGAGAASSSQPLDKRRIVVLPLANLSPEKSDEYLADGMTEELISVISTITGLTVISRMSAMSYKGTSKKVKEIGTELEAGTVLEGSVRKAGNRLRIAIQLIDVPTQANVWSQTYEGNFEDLFAVQSQIAKKVGQTLEVRMLPRVIKNVEKTPTKNTEAYLHYLKGRQSWRERTREGNDRAVKSLEEAIRLDSNFALAYAGLADCYHVYGNYGWWTPKEASLRSKEYALKAIELDNSIAEAHASLAAVIGPHEYDWAGAEAELKRAIELNPNYAIAHQWYSLQLWYRGMFEQSLEEIKAACLLDPLSRIIRANLGWILMAVGNLKQATEYLEKLIESEPAYPVAHYNLAWTCYQESRYEDAIREMKSALSFSGGDARYKCNLACLLGFAGRQDEAIALVADVKAISKKVYVDKVAIASALFVIGYLDEAFDYLEAAYKDGSDSVLSFKREPWFAKWREDPRWNAIETGLGLTGT